MADDLQVIFPERSEDDLSEGLRWLTARVCALLNEDGFGGIGGQFGYGANFENETFVMRRFYWGDCDCGYEEREAAYSAKDPGHSAACYQTELRARMQAYEDANPHPAVRMKTEVTKSDFGVVTITSPADPAEKKQASHACDRRQALFEDELYQELGAKFGVDPHYGAAIHCTCGCKDRWKAWVAANGHTAACSLLLPNFLHKPTGFAVRWYKWIGRDNEVEGECDLRAVLDECANTLTHP